MKKKILIILAVLIIIFFIIYRLTIKPESVKTTYLNDNKEYKNMSSSEIKDIHINRYTEGGLDTKIVTNEEEINSLYNKLINIKYGNETDMACEDNTTVYIINFNDGTSKSINIECDWIIIGNKRYMIEK